MGRAAIRVIAGFVVFALAGVLLLAHWAAPPVPEGETIQERTKRIINNPDPKVREVLRREGAINQVRIKDFTWTGAGMGVLEVDFVVFNGNNFPVKDLTIACDTFGQSGTKIDTKTQKVFSSVPPKTDWNIKRISFGFVNPQSRTAACRITALSPA